MRITWPKDIIDRIALTLAICICVLIAAMLLVEAGRPVPEACNRDSWNAVYIGWDDNAGPCTYPQRATSGLFMFFVFPLFLVWPGTLFTIAYIFYHVIRYRSIQWKKIQALVITWLVIFLLWGLFMLSELVFVSLP